MPADYEKQFARPRAAALHRIAARHRTPSTPIGLWQLGSTLAAFGAVCAAMYASLEISYAITLPLALVGAGLTVRLFVLQHDCGHGSLFRSRRANLVAGTVCGLLTLTPHLHWRRQHAGHHAVWNDLDRRDSGTDIYSNCLTVAEYRALPPFKRRIHRLVQHPAVALLLLPPAIFLALYRVPFDTPADWVAERRAVHLTNIAIVLGLAGLGAVLGYAAVLAVQLPIMVLASIVGVWLFSLQHRFARAHWSRRAEWTVTDASLRGSSFLRLPAPLGWFTGHIGYHHIHHLDSRIPNHRLRACHDALPADAKPTPITLKEGLGAFRFALWDEDARRMTTFRMAARADAAAVAA